LKTPASRFSVEENKLNFARTLLECVEPWLIALMLDKLRRYKTFKRKRSASPTKTMRGETTRKAENIGRVAGSIVNDDHHYAEKETREETYESVGD